MTRYDADPRLLEKLTLEPEQVTRVVADAVRATADSEEALVDAIHVCALFSMIVRLADLLGWDIPSFESFVECAGAMLAGGYALESG